MTTPLFEAMARGIAKAKGIEICSGASYEHSTFGPLAKAALAAITDAGFVCVPRDPTPDMIAAGHEDSGIDGYVNEFWPEVPYRAMIAAAQGDGE